MASATVTIEDCKCIKESDSDVYKPDTEGDLVIFEWFAEKEGLE